MFHQTRPLVAGVILVALTACQHEGPPALTLEEAKQVTATFEDQSFTPPPKTIDDITAILDQQKLADPEAARQARAKVSRKPPSGLSGIDLAAFYWERGLAAREIGDAKREISDLKEAKRLSQGGPWDPSGQILWDLAVAEALAGNFATALRHFNQYLAAVPARGALISRGAVVAGVYTLSGDFAAADRLLAQAEDILVEAHFWSSFSRMENVWTSRLYRGKARMLSARGHYAEAEKFYRQALEVNEAGIRSGGASESSQRYNFQMRELIYSDLAITLARQDRLIEAEIEARNALTASLRRVGRYSSNTAYMLSYLTRVIEAQGRHAEAERLARATIDIYRNVGAGEDALLLARARGYLAMTLVNQGRWRDAVAQFDTIKRALAGDRVNFRKFFAGDLSHALALVGIGRAADARAVAEAALGRRREAVGDNHYDTAEARGVLAMALAGLDDKAGALTNFRAAIPILLQRSRRSDDQNVSRTARDLRLQFILDSYIDLLSRIGGTALESNVGIDAAGEAFRAAQAARGQTVQRALSASAARAAAKDPDLADLVRREQDTLKQVGALNGLYAAGISVPTDQQNPAALKDLRTRIDRLRGARAALAEEIERRFPDYAALMSPKPATIDQARAALKPGEALVVTHVGKMKTYVWAVPRTGKIGFAAVPLGRERLAVVVRDLRRALDPQATNLGDIPAFDIRLSHRLYKALLAPVKAGWKNASSILVVAHGPLGQLPLSVLVTEPAPPPVERAPLFSSYREIPWLARNHAVTVLPSVASLVTLRKLPPAAAGRRSFAGFGDPWFSVAQAATGRSRAAAVRQPAALTARGLFAVRGLPIALRAAPKLEGVSSADLAKLPRLPDTADEVKSIGLALNADLTRDVFTGRQASEHQVKSMTLSGYKVIAFATHGLVPGDLNGLTQPALALSSPKVVGGRDDGLLTMGEILGLRLDTDWVVLSACNTASGQGKGSEAVSGLGRAFFYAGTRALLVSNWPVETTSARQLTTDLFHRQARDATLTRAQALRKTMLALIDGPGFIDDKGHTVFSYAHPIFWAPFSLVGDGGGGMSGT